MHAVPRIRCRGRSGDGAKNDSVVQSTRGRKLLPIRSSGGEVSLSRATPVCACRTLAPGLPLSQVITAVLHPTRGAACHAVRAQMRGDLSKAPCRACLEGATDKQVCVVQPCLSTRRLEINVGRHAAWPRSHPAAARRIPLRQRQAQPRFCPQRRFKRTIANASSVAQGLQKCPSPTLMQGGLPPPSLVAYTGKDSAVSNEKRQRGCSMVGREHF